jgi:hypothetical protein
VDVKKTDKSGRVTTEAHRHGDGLGWQEGISKWNSKPQLTKLPMPPPQQQLPESYYTQAEALKGYAVTAEFITSTEKLAARNSATNMTYECGKHSE